MNLETAINDAHNKLKQNKIKTALLDSEILMSETIKKTREFIIMNHNYEITEKEYNSFKEMIEIRSTGKPIAHLIKKKYFWKNEFYVDEKVLIPRPDTEIIIEQVLKLYKKKIR